MPANVQTMAYYGNVPWHGMGVQVPKWINAEGMIQAAGLDWKVDLRPARGARKINSKGEFSRYEIIRVPRPCTEEEEVLFGVVSRRYQPLQNIEAFSFFDPIVSKGKAYFETAGVLDGGERVWVMAKMPSAMEVVRGDECLKYLLLSNTHTGEGSVVVKFTSVRVVCQNTLMLSMDDGQKAYRVRHSKMMQFRLDELADFLVMTQHVFQRAEEEFKRLAKVQMTGDRLQHYFDTVFPRTGKQTKERVIPQRWAYLQEMVGSRPDLQLAGVQGTLWAAYNAITRFEDFKQPMQEEAADQRLERTWFGSGADIKTRALDKALEVAKSWSN